jgi:ASPIC and UnbV./FG-GAP repeat.
MLSPTLAARQRQISTATPLPKRLGLTTDRAQWMRNALQLARGDGTWAQAADFAGVAATDWSWGSAFVDVDLDGYEDLLVVNGHRWDIRDADGVNRLGSKTSPVPWNREQGEFPRLAARSIALRNTGDVHFTDASKEWGFGADEAISQGIALADFDGDGALDVLVTRLDAAPVVYRNESSQARVAVRLRGTSPNTRGIGARITVKAASLPAQSHEMTDGGYYLSGSDAELSFATGTDSLVDISVRWRDGKLSELKRVSRNRLYEIDEAGASAAPTSSPADSTHALFADATALLGGHTHVDSPFDDFARQPLLPNRLSQLGPGLSWIDVDGDGREDLVVGTGAGGSLAILRNAATRFSPMLSAASPARWDLTTILPVPAQGGGTMLLAGQSSYEAGSPAEALHVASVLGVNVRGAKVEAPVTIAPPESASVGPLALADVNGDGTLDLFVGARVIPGTWPFPAPSHLYLRTPDGRFVPDTVNARALSSLGLLSAATFADLDGDGWPDLIVAAEWGPVRVLHNDHGRFRDVTRELGLIGYTSRWNGLAIGDMDGDGRLDIIATSWGLNIPWTASADRPYELVVGNFGSRGPGLVFARTDSITGKEMPQESLQRLGQMLPGLRDRIASFADYAKMSVDDVLGATRRHSLALGRQPSSTRCFSTGAITSRRTPCRAPRRSRRPSAWSSRTSTAMVTKTSSSRRTSRPRKPPPCALTPEQGSCCSARAGARFASRPCARRELPSLAMGVAPPPPTMMETVESISRSHRMARRQPSGTTSGNARPARASGRRRRQSARRRHAAARAVRNASRPCTRSARGQRLLVDGRCDHRACAAA